MKKLLLFLVIIIMFQCDDSTGPKETPLTSKDVMFNAAKYVVSQIESLNYSPQQTKKLLPKDNSVEGWIIDENTSCWTGVSKDVQGLYDIIDGGAEVYIDNGYKDAAFEGYTDGKNELCVEIYDQSSKENAFVVFEETDIQVDYQPVNDIGDIARLDTSYTYVYQMEATCKKYFLRFNINKELDEH